MADAFVAQVDHRRDEIGLAHMEGRLSRVGVRRAAGVGAARRRGGRGGSPGRRYLKHRLDRRWLVGLMLEGDRR
jgi:hypothetical protein